jgi:hypothetical protein
LNIKGAERFPEHLENCIGPYAKAYGKANRGEKDMKRSRNEKR